MHGFERLGGIADTDTVVVRGAWPVGLFAVAKAVCEGASRVIAIGGPKTRLDLATSWGATIVIDVADVATPRERVQAEFNPSLIMFNQATLIGSLSAGVDHYWKALQLRMSAVTGAGDVKARRPR
jgi:L-iditol 2-dehydrogenase